LIFDVNLSIICQWAVLFSVTHFLQSRLIEESSDIVFLMITLLVLPLFCQLPCVTSKVVQCFLIVNPWLSRSLSFLFPTTSACGPLLILFMVKRYRTVIRKFFRTNKLQPVLVALPVNRNGDFQRNTVQLNIVDAMGQKLGDDHHHDHKNMMKCATRIATVHKWFLCSVLSLNRNDPYTFHTVYIWNLWNPKWKLL